MSPPRPLRGRRGPRSRLTALAAAVSHPLGLTAVGATAAEASAVQCSVDYRTNDVAKALLDGMWAHHQDPLGIAVQETRTDYDRFDDAVYVPGSWTGTMSNGDTVNSSSTFAWVRTFYQDDPAWPKVEGYLAGGAAPVFTYHRFWAQADIALAMGSYAELLE